MATIVVDDDSDDITNSIILDDASLTVLRMDALVNGSVLSPIELFLQVLVNTIKEEREIAVLRRRAMVHLCMVLSPMHSSSHWEVRERYFEARKRMRKELERVYGALHPGNSDAAKVGVNRFMNALDARLQRAKRTEGESV